VSYVSAHNWIDANVPARFRNASLGSYEPRHPSQERALRAVRRWVEIVQDPDRQGEGPMLALIGPQGTGKSHLLYGAAKLLVAGEPQVVPYAAPWYRLADRLRAGFEEGAAVRDRLWGARVAMIDEVRPTSGTNFDDTELAKYSCHAYDAIRPVMITTNVSPLDKVMGGPAASRFDVIKVEGPDYREEGRN